LHARKNAAIPGWRAGNREQAGAHLISATTMYREMDMRFWLAQAEAEMRELP
jgi:hypothetical protein